MDFSNLIGPLIESVAAAWYIEKFLKLKEIDAFKSKVIKFMPLVAILIAAIGEYYKFSLLSDNMLLMVIIFLALFLWKLHPQTNIKSLLWVVLPFCVFTLIGLLFPTFIYADLIENLSVFSRIKSTNSMAFCHAIRFSKSNFSSIFCFYSLF